MADLHDVGRNGEQGDQKPQGLPEVLKLEPGLSQAAPPYVGGGPGGHFAVKTRGLPYEATKNEIIQFLESCKIRNGQEGVHILVAVDGRPNGEAIVELESRMDVDNALKCHNRNMGRRYVEVSEISREEMNWELSRQPGVPLSGDYVVRLRGLPYASTAKEVLWFLKDCRVGGEDRGVHFTFGPDGRPSGEAFVELVGEDDVSKALAHNHEHMGKRYVEIFRASRGQMEFDCRMEEKVGGGSGSGGVVRLRGLPYKCTEDDVRKFFSGMSIPAGGVVLQVDESGRETGEGFAEFTSVDDIEKALAKHRQEIGHRYIEIFRSTHAEITPVRGAMGARGTPYDRPGRGGTFGRGYVGFGAKYGTGYERQYRGRGRGGPPHPGGGFPPFDPYASTGFYGEEYFPPPPHGGFEDGSGGFPPPASDHSLVAYPPIRPSQPSTSREGFMGGLTKAKHVIRMRGLPFSAKEKDIMDFFTPVVPLKVNVDFDHYGRPAGEAEVHFATHDDAVASMQKNNAHMDPAQSQLPLSGPVGGSPALRVPEGGAGRYVPSQHQPTWGEPRPQPVNYGQHQQHYGNVEQQQYGTGTQYGGGQQQYGAGAGQYGGYQQQGQQQGYGMAQQSTSYGHQQSRDGSQQSHMPSHSPVNYGQQQQQYGGVAQNQYGSGTQYGGGEQHYGGYQQQGRP